MSFSHRKQNTKNLKLFFFKQRKMFTKILRLLLWPDICWRIVVSKKGHYAGNQSLSNGSRLHRLAALAHEETPVILELT